MRMGIEVLHSKDFDSLRNRRVGLLSHQAAITQSGATSAQLLHEALGSRLIALFGPEHGFLGQASAGEHTFTRQHPDWGIPVHALYGERRKPLPEMLEGIDLLICDLQDLGVRCYTYLATLRNMLEACQEANIEVMVCDRPIPLPNVVDGPLLAAGFSSFVAPCHVPLVYGMTPAESACWMQRECFPNVHLTTIPMEGWRRSDAAWDGARPPFIPPSPAIRSWESAMTYAATLFCEALPAIDCGRGTNLAFRILGTAPMKAEIFCHQLTDLRLPGLACHPYRYVAADGLNKGCELDGVRLTVTDPAHFQPVMVSMALLQVLTQNYGIEHVWNHCGARPDWFDKLYGSEATRQALLQDTPLQKIKTEWEAEHHTFLKTRAEVLHYDAL